MNRSFWPDTEATGQLLTELVIDLAVWFDVTVIAGTPNLANVEADKEYGAIGESRGVQIRHAWHSRFSKHSSAGRMANLLTFTVSAWLAARALRRSPDVIVVETDPFFLPLVGRQLRRKFHRATLVCYLQDIYPDIAVAVGKIREGIVTRTLRSMLFNVYRCANRVIVLSRDMQQRCESLGVPRASLETVPNWADTNAVWPIKSNNEFRRQNGLEGRFVVMYSGNMGLAHELDSLIEAAVILRDQPAIEWVFIGDGARRETLESRARDLGLRQMRFLPYQSRSFLAQSLSAADVHLISVRPGASASVMPSKFYGILASGTPTVALIESGTEMHDLIHEHEVGFTCDPGDAIAVAECIRQLAADANLVRRLGANARTLAETTFCRTRQTARIAGVLFQAIGREVPTEIIQEEQARAAPKSIANIPSPAPLPDRCTLVSEVVATL